MRTDLALFEAQTLGFLNLLAFHGGNELVCERHGRENAQGSGFRA
jgi:hypothetical protein